MKDTPPLIDGVSFFIKFLFQKTWNKLVKTKADLIKTKADLFQTNADLIQTNADLVFTERALSISLTFKAEWHSLLQNKIANLLAT